MKKGQTLLRSVAFFLVLAVTVIGIQSCFRVIVGNGEHFVALKKEKRGRLDAVYIGASDVYEFWQPLFGWNDHGIAVWNLTVSAVSSAAVRYMVEEARTRQPGAMIIISLTSFKINKVDTSLEKIHRVADYMPLSVNKLRMIKDMTDREGYRGFDKLEFYLPIIRFHTRWSTLRSEDFNNFGEDYKGSSARVKFRTAVRDLSSMVIREDTRCPVPEDVLTVFEDLLDYCDAHQLNVLFVKSPQVAYPEFQRRLNTLEDIAAERGYPCLDMIEEYEATNIDPRTDYLDEWHTNIHGSLKFSKVLGDYLVENYHLEDKRGQDGWADWDRAADRYINYMNQYALPFEIEHAPRFTSDIPVLDKLKVDDRTIELTWKGVEGVEGYEIQRKSQSTEGERKSRWKACASVDAGIERFSDQKLDYSMEYTYTVVPYRVIDGERVYGSFDPTGKSAKIEKTA